MSNASWQIDSQRSKSVVTEPKSSLKSVLRHIDQKCLSEQVAKETRNREVHLPPVSVYRWWARRTLSINSALLDAVKKELDLLPENMLVADPFAGGGVIPLAALKQGLRVYAQDLNPWVGKGLAAMLSLPSVRLLRDARLQLVELSDAIATKAYGTMFADGGQAQISQTLRVAVSPCSKCGFEHRLFPHALVSLTKRKELKTGKAILACSSGHLFFGNRSRKTACATCGEIVNPRATYLKGRIASCPSCKHEEPLSKRASHKLWRWEVALVERTDGKRREMCLPTIAELSQASSKAWKPSRTLGRIPDSQETRVLTRHGFHRWEDIYPNRQRYILEQLLGLSRTFANPRVREAVEMAILGSAEMAGHLSRWDRFYLKSFESMSSHRFNFSTLVAEPNVIGAGSAGRGTVFRRLMLFERAAAWLEENDFTKRGVKILQASQPRRLKVPSRDATIVVGSSERMLLPSASVDLILTDPPYYDDVQYHELSLPFRAWARLSKERGKGEAVVIPHVKDLAKHARYRGVLTRVFKEFHRVLKPAGRLIFSYANREPAAWVNLFAALKATEFKPVGYTIVQSENEHDLQKRNGRSCHLDLILELAGSTAGKISQWHPKPVFKTNEEKYLISVGEAFLRSGTMVNGWESHLVMQLKSEIFVE